MNTKDQGNIPKKSLQHRVLHASAWTFGGHVTSQFIRFGSNLVMTRLLVPEMFGIMVLANVLLIGLHLFSDIGLRQNIVQHQKGSDQTFLNTIWTVQIMRGLVVWIVALCAALALYLFRLANWVPPSSAYAEPVLPLVIAVLSINAVINGFEPTKYGIASRTMSLAKLTQVDLVCQVSGILLMVTWAMIDRSIWALVGGSILTSILRVTLGSLLLPGQINRLHWDRKIFLEILNFGKWVFASSILGFLATNGDRLILGAITDASTLGMYSIAFFMVASLRDVFVKLIGNVAFPALSEVVRERPADLRHVYYRFRKPLDASTLVVVGLLFFSGHILIDTLYDPRYSSAGHMLEILCIMLFEVRFAVAGQCFMALGKPKLTIPIIGIQVVALYVFMPIAFVWYGFDGALWMAGGSVLFTIPMTFYLKIKLALFDYKKELLALPWLMLGLAMGWGLDQIVMRMH